MSTTLWIIFWGAVATYLTRVGGHLVLSRFERIHPRVEAGLNAVAAIVSLRFGLLAIFLIGAVVLIAARQFMG